MINNVGAKAVTIRLREEMDFRLDVGELEGLINDPSKLIILNSPQNPTGGVLTKIDIDALAHLEVLPNDRTKLIILNSPQNPTGGLLAKFDSAPTPRAIGHRSPPLVK